MDESIVNYKDKLRRYFRFNKEEIKIILIAIFTFSFILSFDQWGKESFDVAAGLFHFSIALIIVSISMFIHETSHRLVALYTGFRAETKLWWHGIWIGLILCVISRGKFMMFAATGVWMHHLAYHRLGWFRYGPNTLAFSLISLVGPLTNLFVGTFFKELSNIFTFSDPINSLFQQIFFFNLLFAAWNLLPIPPLDGSRVFFASRLTYVFVAGSIIAYAILVVLGIYSYIFALLLGGLAWLLFYIAFESKLVYIKK